MLTLVVCLNITAAEYLFSLRDFEEAGGKNVPSVLFIGSHENNKARFDKEAEKYKSDTAIKFFSIDYANAKSDLINYLNLDAPKYSYYIKMWYPSGGSRDYYENSITESALEEFVKLFVFRDPLNDVVKELTSADVENAKKYHSTIMVLFRGEKESEEYLQIMNYNIKAIKGIPYITDIANSIFGSTVGDDLANVLKITKTEKPQLYILGKFYYRFLWRNEIMEKFETKVVVLG